MKKINVVSIILKPTINDELKSVLVNLVRYLERRNKEVVLHLNLKNELASLLPSKTMKSVMFQDDKFIFSKSHLIITLGGDGTLIGVARKVTPKIPIFGINLGQLGFITEYSRSNFYDDLENVLKGKFEIIKKQLYKLQASKADKPLYFFNDVVFTKNDIARMFTLHLQIEGEHVYDLSGDGLIISTTVGSTAYSMAAGGPIVHPEVNAFVLTPICPHSLTNRPMVVPDTYLLKVELINRAESVTVTIDGQVAIDVSKDDFITISKDKKRNISFIKNPERTYFHTLKEKFVHGRRNN